MNQKAFAKINLYLHVTGKRDDGYHLLDSLVVFAKDACDELVLSPASAYALKIEGAYATLLLQEDASKNLITKALNQAAQNLSKALNFNILLRKNLPLASGMGGGSADAAAALRLAAGFWQVEVDHPAIIAAAKKTGSDTLCCLESKPCYFAGIGDELTAVPKIPSFYMVLVNPHIAMPTPPVFAARTGAFSAPARFESMPDHARDFAALLAERHNDLQTAAISLCPTIQDVLDAIDAQKGCLLARLSGSGATCFGLFADQASADLAATRLKARQPDWWVVASGV